MIKIYHKLNQLQWRHEEWRASPDLRKTLEGYAYQYLTVVPHERRFCQPGFGDFFIAGSARMIPDFSAEKAAQAFNLIERIIFGSPSYRKKIQASKSHVPSSTDTAFFNFNCQLKLKLLKTFCFFSNRVTAILGGQGYL